MAKGLGFTFCYGKFGFWFEDDMVRAGSSGFLGILFLFGRIVDGGSNLLNFDLVDVFAGHFPWVLLFVQFVLV